MSINNIYPPLLPQTPLYLPPNCKSSLIYTHGVQPMYAHMCASSSTEVENLPVATLHMKGSPSLPGCSQLCVAPR